MSSNFELKMKAGSIKAAGLKKICLISVGERLLTKNITEFSIKCDWTLEFI